MHFAIHCLDKRDHTQTRLDNRAAHLDYLRSYGDKVVLAGPLLSEDGQVMVGSLLVLELEDRAAADEFVAGDPYGKAGLFESVTVTNFRKVLP